MAKLLPAQLVNKNNKDKIIGRQDIRHLTRNNTKEVEKTNENSNVKAPEKKKANLEQKNNLDYINVYDTEDNIGSTKTSSIQDNITKLDSNIPPQSKNKTNKFQKNTQKHKKTQQNTKKHTNPKIK